MTLSDATYSWVVRGARLSMVPGWSVIPQQFLHPELSINLGCDVYYLGLYSEFQFLCDYSIPVPKRRFPSLQPIAVSCSGTLTKSAMRGAATR